MNRKAAMEWIVSKDTGISSRTMWYALMCDEHNRENKCIDKPYDAEDFGRCYRFAKQCELTEDDLWRVAEVFPSWRPFIVQWDELTELYLAMKWNTLYNRIIEIRERSMVG